MLNGEEVEFAGHEVQAPAPIDVEYLPEAQLVQAPDPATALYFPATHGEHDPPLGPEEPALQVHAAAAELPAGEPE